MGWPAWKKMATSSSSMKEAAMPSGQNEWLGVKKILKIIKNKVLS
jgi:hypothetical protein